jgi:Ca-activated chloride channel homolog
MKRVLLSLLLLSSPGFLWAQEGPKNETSEGVARPRKKPSSESATPAAPAAEAPAGDKIESKYKRRPDGTIDAPSFRSDVVAVTVDVAVVDNKGRFIPGLKKENFRILEDGVPQTISNYGVGEAPMTVAMVVEFSNLYQQYWSEPWYQTLTAAYGFIETLKPED